ncbi:hypothetical protein [Lysobacter antibioticus]|uniref:hypothetical protein n=1 Tax=Lysobacter antibioticus TaxID=84531 RepID=UPI0011DF404E|nr:hypothetical protein [Lysobacter antibioticus]
MPSYIFISPRSDPGMGHPLTDPIMGRGVRPTMGTCRPDIRRLVRPGDQIFVISGSMGPGVRQYVVGGIEVGSKLIDQLAAYEKYPEHRLDFNGRIKHGNIIVTAAGNQDPRDRHSNFDRRIVNYIEGRSQVVLETEKEVSLGREYSANILARIFEKPKGSSIREIIGRHRKMTELQANTLRHALRELKREARR